MIGPAEMGDAPSKVYNLTLPVRGSTEPNTYPSIERSCQTPRAWRAACVALSIAFAGACSTGESAGPPRDHDAPPSGGSNHAGNAPGGIGSGSNAGGYSGSGLGGSSAGGGANAGGSSTSVA